MGSYEIQWLFHGFEVPETNGSLILNFLQIPETISSLIRTIQKTDRSQGQALQFSKHHKVISFLFLSWYPGGPHSGTQLVPTGYHTNLFFFFTKKNEWLYAVQTASGQGITQQEKALQKALKRPQAKKPWEKLKMEDFI